MWTFVIKCGVCNRGTYASKHTHTHKDLHTPVSAYICQQTSQNKPKKIKMTYRWERKADIDRR